MRPGLLSPPLSWAYATQQARRAVFNRAVLRLADNAAALTVMRPLTLKVKIPVCAPAAEALNAVDSQT